MHFKNCASSLLEPLFRLQHQGKPCNPSLTLVALVQGSFNLDFAKLPWGSVFLLIPVIRAGSRHAKGTRLLKRQFPLPRCLLGRQQWGWAGCRAGTPRSSELVSGSPGLAASPAAASSLPPSPLLSVREPVGSLTRSWKKHSEKKRS